MNNFYGTGVAIVTPFNTDGGVDYNGLQAVVDHVIDGGVDYLVVLGTTGESATLNKDEKKAIWQSVNKFAKGRVPLMAGIGGNNTYEVQKNIEEFDTTGYSAILSVSPYYNKPSQEGIYQHYKALAQNIPLPMFLYNVPGRTGSCLSAETTVRLAHDFKNIIGTKDAAGNFEHFNHIMRDKPEGFLFISGDDPVALPLVAMGGAGVISVIANALPSQVSNMIKLCLKSDFEAARKINYNLIEFTRLMFVEGNPPGIKTALKHLGLCNDTVRLPLVPVSSPTSAAILKEIQKINA